MCKLLIFLQFPSVGNLKKNFKKNLKNIFKKFFFFVIGLLKTEALMIKYIQIWPLRCVCVLRGTAYFSRRDLVWARAVYHATQSTP